MKKLLITGFEPFGGESLNASWEAVNLLANKIGEYELTKLLLPVVFDEASKVAINRASQLNPDAILCVGQAGGRSAITPEFVAINLRHALTPDNKGNKPQDEPVILGGETAYFCTLPARKMVSGIKSIGIPSQLSYSAGTYVCNDLFYTLLAHYGGSNTRVGFIHIPYCTEQNKTPSMALSEVVKGLTIAIESI